MGTADTLIHGPGETGSAPINNNSPLEQTSSTAASVTPRGEVAPGGLERLFPVTGATPSSEVGSGGAAEQQPESEVVATEPEHGGSAQRPPLDNYAYCYSLKLDTALRDYEIELAEATRQYESECQKEAWRSGWLKPQDFCFSGKGSQDWFKRREGASYRKNEVVVPVRLPNFRFRGKSASSSSGRISAATVRYRRSKTAFVRGLYFQLIIRSHMTECNGAPDSEAKVAGEKRKRDSAEGSEGGSAAASGAGAEVEAEPRINDTSSDCRNKSRRGRPPKSNKSRRGRPPKSKGSSDEKKQSTSKGSSDEKKQSTVSSDEQKRREAAVSAFLCDLPHPLLKVLIKDAKVRSMTIKSEKKMRKRILLEIKEEARRTRQDPLQVLEAAVRMGGSSGTMRQYCILGSLLSGSTVGSTLPTAANVAKAKRELMELAVEDLQLSATPDGYRISLLRAVEMEALRLMQTIRSSKFAGGGMEARTVGLDPDDSLNWQDFFHVKLTFDARRITKNCSQTEVMIIFLPKGQGGVERCQKALHMRTIAVWSGKDSKENVVRNLTEIVKEAAQLEEKGIAFSRVADSFLGVAESEQYNEWLSRRKAAYDQLLSDSKPSFDEWLRKPEASEDPVPFRRVGFLFWVAADMLAQCSLIGQGCAGHRYCAHCDAHKENRHLPFELFKVKKAENFWKLANDNDIMVETLWAINTCEDLETKGRDPYGLTEDGLMACTLPCSDPDLARVAAAKPPSQAQAAAAAAVPPAPAVPAQQAASKGESDLRRAKRIRGAKVPSRAAPAVPVAVLAGQEASPQPEMEFPKGPDVDVIKGCYGWKKGHNETCQCNLCVIPPGTIVRRMIQPGFSRESAYLNEHWKGISRGRFPFCALHCTMRITEAMFYNICQNALAAGDPAVARLNSAMELIGLKSKKFQKVRMFNCDNYERLSFLGHEALQLLKRDATTGKRNVQVLLEHLWPAGDASESKEGRNFVQRSIVLWECWGEVVELMSERDPAKLRKSNNVRHGDGFARFGKVCREFCFRYQALFHKTHCKSFYLHTLLAHGGDFMRELERHGMCLGMMSNSGAERRHEYGRRAFRRSLCGGCWAKHDQELANKANMSAFLTLREILIWQYGSDLVSHEKARRAAAPPADARASESGTDPQAVSDGAPSEVPQARLRLTRENLEKHCDVADGLNRLLEPLLSPTEAEDESRRDAPMDETPEAASGLGETVQAGWQRVEHDQSLALNSISVPHDEADGLPADRCYAGSACKMTYDIGRDSRLTNGVCDVVSDIDGDGSEDCSSDGGSDSDSSDCSSDGGPRVRFDELEDFSEDDDDSDASCEVEIAPSFRGQNMCRTRSEKEAAGRHVAQSAAGQQDTVVPVTGSASTADSDNTGQNAKTAPLIRTVGAAGGIGEGLGAEGLARQVQNKERTEPKKRRPRPRLTEEQKAAKRREALHRIYRDDSIL
jgi:hypothetical protein